MAKSEKSFENSKQVVAVRPAVAVENTGFIYNGTEDLKNLIKFVGSRPTIDEEGDIYFKKQKIEAGSLVLRDSFGNVTDVLPLETAAIKWEVVASHDFTDADKNEVKAKVIAPRGKKVEGEMTRKELRDALKAAGVKFPDSQPKAVYQKLWDEHLTKGEAPQA